MKCPYSGRVDSIPYGTPNKPVWWIGPPWNQDGWFNDEGLYEAHGDITGITLTWRDIERNNEQERILSMIQFRSVK